MNTSRPQAENAESVKRDPYELLHERLRFETLLSDLSAAFMALSPEEVSSQLGHWLSRIVEALHLDRSSILQFSRDGRQPRVTHNYGRVGVPTLTTTPLAELPWYFERLRSGERLLLKNLPDSLPLDATAERDFCIQQGLKSTLAIPLKISGRLLGILTFGSFDDRTEWPEALVDRIELLGSVFAHAMERQQADEALRQSEERLRLALEAAAMGAWEWEIVEDKVTWSDNVAPLFGLRPGEFKNTYAAYIALAFPSDRLIVEQAVEDCLRGHSPGFHMEHRVLWPNGSIHWLEAKGKALRDKSGAPFRMLGTITDISERKRVEAAALESEQLYESLVNSIDGIVWEVDVASFMFTFVSAQAERILGYPVTRWLGDPQFWASHIHADDRSWATEFCLRATQESRAHEFQYRMIAADGRAVWLHDVVSVVVEQGRPTKLRGVMVDITERKKVEKALRESEIHFRTIFEDAPIGLAYVESDFRLGKINRALCQFLGYTETELQQVPFVDITHPDDADKDAALAARLFAGEIQSYQIEKRFIKKNGEIVWGMLTATLIRDKDGRVITGLGMIENISARKEVEDQLRQAQKMDAFGQLAGGVAHDFNNLLTAINGYSEICLGQLRPHDSMRSSLEEILKAGDRAAALTRQLLAFSRKQVLRPKIIDLGMVVDDLSKMLRRLIGENIKLVTSVDSWLGHVLADPGQFEQIIVNLAVNARDAMPRGGKLMIELSNVYLDEEYSRNHIAVQPGPHVMLAVSDTGCGMSRAIQQRIFEPFFTTKEPGKGTGLGLSTVYGIVKQSGGHIYVYSEEGIGTKFRIYLPRVDLPIEDEQPVASVQEPAGGDETVLLVEDDDSVRNMIVRILRDRGYEVVAACDGHEALLLCEKEQRKFNLLLTDVIMPKMSGPELEEKLRRLRPTIKVLYMSGYSGDALLHHGALDDQLRLIEKPFTKDELLRRVRAVLNEEPRP